MMAEYDNQDGGQAAPVLQDDNTALVNVNGEELRGGNKRCSRGCSRAMHCSLTVPYLVIIGLVILSVACFYVHQDRLGGCVLFGVIQPTKGVFQHGPNAVCLAVTGGEMVLCAFAILYATVMVVKAFRSSRLFTWLIFLELLLLFLIFFISIGISSTMHIGINNTCVSINPGSTIPDFGKCGDIKVHPNTTEKQKHPVWDTILQESLIAAWMITLMYMALVFVWVMLSLFACCALQSRKNRCQGGQCGRLSDEEGMPIMREPNIVYGAT